MPVGWTAGKADIVVVRLRFRYPSNVLVESVSRFARSPVGRFRVARCELRVTGCVLDVYGFQHLIKTIEIRFQDPVSGINAIGNP